MSSIEVLSRTQRIVVSSTQKIVVKDKIAKVVRSSDVVEVINTGPRGPAGIPGPPGTPAGRRWYGEGPPGTIIGAAPGDEYLDILTGDLYNLQ